MTNPKAPPGLTKREYFAAMAMQGIVSNSYLNLMPSRIDAAESAVRIADALIEALNKADDEQ